MNCRVSLAFQGYPKKWGDEWCMNIIQNSESEFVPVTYPQFIADSVRIEPETLETTLTYIKKHRVCKAFLCGIEDYSFLAECTSVKHLKICFQRSEPTLNNKVDSTEKRITKYDLSVLYLMPELKSISLVDDYDMKGQIKAKIDLGRISQIELYDGPASYLHNLNHAYSLKSLVLRRGYRAKNITEIKELKFLDTFLCDFSSLESLEGCEDLQRLQCMYLSYNRRLFDISSIAQIAKSLKALRIENCPNIKDFSALKKLENLELLELSGSNVLQDLSFLNFMKNLKTFIFSVNVADGDISPCLRIPYVYLEKNRRHYNLKESDMPKGAFVHGNESIEIWRRLE